MPYKNKKLTHYASSRENLINPNYKSEQRSQWELVRKNIEIAGREGKAIDERYDSRNFYNWLVEMVARDFFRPIIENIQRRIL